MAIPQGYHYLRRRRRAGACSLLMREYQTDTEPEQEVERLPVSFIEWIHPGCTRYGVICHAIYFDVSHCVVALCRSTLSNLQ